MVAGLEVPIRYNDEDSVTIGAEYFYNDAGYDDASLYPWLVFNDAFTPFYLGKHYAGVYVFLPGPGALDDGHIAPLLLNERRALADETRRALLPHRFARARVSSARRTCTRLSTALDFRAPWAPRYSA